MSQATHDHDGTDTTLRGRWLLLARVAWVLVAVLVIGLSAVIGPGQYDELKTVCIGAECSSFGLTPGKVQELEDLGLSAGVFAGLVSGLLALNSLLWFVTGAIIFWRRSDDRMALFTSVTLVATGGFLTASVGTGDNVVLEVLVEALSAISFVLLITLLFIFPDGRFAPHWSRYFLILWVAFAVFVFALAEFVPAVEEFLGLIYVVTFISPVVAQVYRFRKVSTQLQRQQTKWVLLGMAGYAVGVLWPYMFLDDDSIMFGLVDFPSIMVASSLIPLSIAFSIMRYRLWDLGIFLNRTLVYAVLTATLVGTYFGIVVGLQAAFGAVTDQGSAVAVVMSTLAIAALFQPLRRRIQNFIDRRFYRRKYDAAVTLAGFGDKIRDEVDLEKLREELVGLVHDTMRPAHASLWLRESGTKSQGRTL